MQALKQCLADNYDEISDNRMGGPGEGDAYMIDDGGESRSNSCGEPHVGLCRVQVRVSDAEAVDVRLRWDALQNNEILAWARQMSASVSTTDGLDIEFSVSPHTLFRLVQLAVIVEAGICPNAPPYRVGAYEYVSRRTGRALRRLAIVLQSHWRVQRIH